MIALSKKQIGNGLLFFAEKFCLKGLKNAELEIVCFDAPIAAD